MLVNKKDEEKRLAVLEEYAILDTEDEQVFDDITHLASYICHTPIALISLVARDKQWFKSKVGLEVSETPREGGFCHHAIQQPETLIVKNALEDERFASHPFVIGEPHIRFYAGAPIITSEGYTLGSLCVIDSKPEDLSGEQQKAIEALAR